MLIGPSTIASRIALSTLIAIFLLLGSVKAHAETVRRFGLVFANNLGGPRTTILHYAESMRTRCSVLVELGGHRADDVVALFGASRDEVLAGLEKLDTRIREAKRSGQYVTLFALSGHERGALRLGGDESRCPR